MLVEAANVEQYWDRLSSQRLTWAFDAYARFVDSLSSDVRGHFSGDDDQKEAYVVVFGETQVGKTTLILDLMGLSEAGLQRVSRVLRGGRAAGKSATSTAMEYRRSSDSHWYFIGLTPNKTQHNDAEMQTVLGDVREDMFKDRLFAEKPLVVWIPNDCFDTCQSLGSSVRILDLPGAKAADEVERKHVWQMAQNYLPNADLILLVGRSDGLSFLQPTSLNLPSIEDWQLVPNRFRIITTYSFTPCSVIKKLKEQKTIDAKFFRQLLLSEIQTFGLKLDSDAADPRLFFPLEFGDSWRTAERNLVTMLEPVITQLKNQLQQDIKASATKVSRLRNAIDVHVTVRKIKERGLKQIDEELDNINKQRITVLADCESAEEGCRQTQIKIDKTTEFFCGLELENLKREVQSIRPMLIRRNISQQEKVPNEPNGAGNNKEYKMLDLECEFKKVNKLEKSTAHFKNFITHFTSKLRQHFEVEMPHGSTKKTNSFWISVLRKYSVENKTAKVSEIITRCFIPLRDKLASYRLETYYPLFSKDFENDKLLIKKAMEEAVNDGMALAAKFWMDYAEISLKEIIEDIQCQRRNQHCLQRLLSDLNSDMAGLDRQIADCEQQRVIYKEKMALADESSRRFTEILQQAYFDELCKRQQRIAQTPSPIQAFIELFAADQLIDDRGKLINILS